MKLYITLSLLSLLFVGNIKNKSKNELTIQETKINELHCKLDSIQHEYNLLKNSYLLKPIKNNVKITSLYGKRKDPNHGDTRHHNGIDIKPTNKKDIYILASHDGLVKTDNIKNDCNGLSVEIKNEDYQTKYFHLSKILVTNNSTIQKGDTLGIIGNTGKSTGTHLHYEVYKNTNGIYKIQNPSELNYHN